MTNVGEQPNCRVRIAGFIDEGADRAVAVGAGERSRRIQLLLDLGRDRLRGPDEGFLRCE